MAWPFWQLYRQHITCSPQVPSKETNIWGVPKMGYPQIIHCNRIFHEIFTIQLLGYHRNSHGSELLTLVSLRRVWLGLSLAHMKDLKGVPWDLPVFLAVFPMYLAHIWVCLKIVYPLNPMVLLIIIPFLNGYFIGNINPTFSDKPISCDLPLIFEHPSKIIQVRPWNRGQSPTFYGQSPGGGFHEAEMDHKKSLGWVQVIFETILAQGWSCQETR